MSILDTIVENKRHEIAVRKREVPSRTLIQQLAGSPPPRDFRAALLSSSRPSPRVIAEVKRRSPSKGVLLPALDAATIARVYEQSGAAAISVLADERFFGGSLGDLHSVRNSVAVPILCKEFIIDEYQVFEARAGGADAILLIAAILAVSEIRELRQLAARLGMAALVEVHDRAQLGVALAAGADIIGINNRDLHTFRIDLAVSRDLRPLIPTGVVTVSESGIRSREDRGMMALLGIDALLIGESLLTAQDVSAATRLMCGLDVRATEGSLI